jgi:hypothetical protein
MENNRSQLAGILSIVSGAIGVLMGISFVLILLFMGNLINSIEGGEPVPEGFFNIIFAMYSIIGFIFVAIGALSIIGGIFSIQRKNWGLSLAGAIAASLSFYYCGIIAVIFVCLGKEEFDKQKETTLVTASPPAITGTGSSQVPS